MTFSKWEAGARLTRASRSLFLSIVGRQIASQPRSQHSDYATNPATSGAARFVARPRDYTPEASSLPAISTWSWRRGTTDAGGRRPKPHSVPILNPVTDLAALVARRSGP